MDNLIFKTKVMTPYLMFTAHNPYMYDKMWSMFISVQQVNYITVTTCK